MADDIQVSVLMRCLPKRIQQRVQLQLKEDSSYMDVMWPRTGRRRRSSMSLEWFKAMFQQVDLRLWKKMLSHGRARASSKEKGKEMRRASPRAKDHGMVALAQEKARRVTRKVGKERANEIGANSRLVREGFRAIVTIVASMT